MAIPYIKQYHPTSSFSIQINIKYTEKRQSINYKLEYPNKSN